MFLIDQFWITILLLICFAVIGIITLAIKKKLRAIFNTWGILELVFGSLLTALGIMLLVGLIGYKLHSPNITLSETELNILTWAGGIALVIVSIGWFCSYLKRMIE